MVIKLKEDVNIETRPNGLRSVIKMCCVDSCIARPNVTQGEFSEESPFSNLTGFMRCVTGSMGGALITEVEVEFPIRPTHNKYTGKPLKVAPLKYDNL